MPIYEYRCRACGKKTTALVLVRERASEVRCQFCQGADLERLWSRFATVKSEDARMEALADASAMSGLDENDPKSMMQWMKRMGREMGEDLGSDFEEAMEQEMAGGSGEGAGENAAAAGGGDLPGAIPTGGAGDDL